MQKLSKRPSATKSMSSSNGLEAEYDHKVMAAVVQLVVVIVVVIVVILQVVEVLMKEY